MRREEGGEVEKKSHLQIVSSFVSGAAPQLPSEQVLFIHADKVTYSWGLTQNSLIDWEAQIAYFTSYEE